ncbi:hypothetical protein XENOCAPTIV_027859 [Xenoophorus captivus]|uniref:Uncharacterized protein n=1 Tax=Xenoophorus captivus TaxID=1517983 RepID=A0ABV0RDU5_9TELE
MGSVNECTASILVCLYVGCECLYVYITVRERVIVTVGACSSVRWGQGCPVSSRDPRALCPWMSVALISSGSASDPGGQVCGSLCPLLNSVMEKPYIPIFPAMDQLLNIPQILNGV